MSPRFVLFREWFFFSLSLFIFPYFSFISSKLNSLTLLYISSSFFCVAVEVIAVVAVSLSFFIGFYFIDQMLIFVEVGQQQNHKKNTEANYIFRKDTKNERIQPSSIRFFFLVVFFGRFRLQLLISPTHCTKMNFILKCHFFPLFSLFLFSLSSSEEKG